MTDLIDYDFCRRNHGFDTHAAAKAWFAQSIPPDLRTFAPWFSPVDYLLGNGDLRATASNPIAHYLLHGHGERRAVKPAPMPRQYDGAAAATRAMPRDDARIAVVLHIYYPGFVPYFLDRLEALDLPDWDVFISAPADLLREHGPTLRAALGPRLRSLRAVPNRGRNFAPLFVDFAGELGDYDVICHCHSKESRHSGRRQTEWADYLISALIGAPDATRGHVNLILSGACDVVAPSPFIGMPPWASHTLSNSAQFADLCRRLGLEAATGFIAYPIGGMFWMARSVYRRIARLNLSHDDFPPEPSRPDGELHHALERLIGRIAGPRLAFYDQVTGRYIAPDATLRAEVRRFVKTDDLCEVINANDVISFDFFDTLCVRSTGDEEWAKRRVEFVIGQDYVARRNAAEARLRAALGPSGDVPLVGIAQELAGEGFEDAPRAVALERTFDLATLSPRPQVVHAYEHAVEQDKRVMIVSDSYYDRGFIRSFLTAHGISEPAEILTSADMGMRKDRGDLWHHLATLRGRARGVHIGDNVHSDIQRAAEHGFTTFYVPHWREEMLPFSGLAATLVSRNLTNPAFARSIDREPPEDSQDELSKRDLDADARRLPNPRRPAKDRVAR